MTALETRMKRYLRREGFLRNLSVGCLLGMTAFGLNLGYLGLYETEPTAADVEITKLEVQKYKFLTERLSEKEIERNLKTNPRLWRVLNRINPDSPILKRVRWIAEEQTPDEVLEKQISKLKEQVSLPPRIETAEQIQEVLDKSGVKTGARGSVEAFKEKHAETLDALKAQIPELAGEERELIQSYAAAPEKYSQILKTVPVERLQRERLLLRKRIVEFVKALKKADEEFDLGNLFKAEEYYRASWRYAQEIKSWEACLLVGIRFLTLVAPRRATGGKYITAQACFEDALKFAVEKKSASGCNKVGVALKLIGMEQLAEVAFEQARHFEERS